jgi:hypothetical protein
MLLAQKLLTRPAPAESAGEFPQEYTAAVV